MKFEVSHLPHEPGLDAPWEAAAITLDQVRPESSDPHPAVRFQCAYSDEALFGRFKVEDRHVLSRYVQFMDPVYQDSCVEFFVQPGGAGPYFNFEFNAGGCMLATCVIDPARVDGGALKHCLPLTPGQAQKVSVLSSLPGRVDPERAGPVTWTLSFRIPLELMEERCGPLRPLAGQHWRGNFYKCGDQTSHPHWISWAPLQELNFHRPEDFGIIHFI